MKRTMILLIAIICAFSAEASDRIRGDQLEFNQVKKSLTISGNARIDLVKKKTVLRGDQIEVFYGENRSIEHIQVTGNVHIQLKKRRISIKSRILRYEPDSSQATLQGNVLFTSGETSANAGSMRFNLESEKGQMMASNDQSVVLKFVRKERPDIKNRVRLSARVISFSITDKLLGLKGKVDIEDPEKNLRFKSDRAEIYFDEEDQPYEMFADGNFSMRQKTQLSSADSARFYLDSQRVLLLGSAKVEDKSKQLDIVSEKIELLMEPEKGIIKGGKQPVKINIPLPE